MKFTEYATISIVIFISLMLSAYLCNYYDLTQAVLLYSSLFLTLLIITSVSVDFKGKINPFLNFKNYFLAGFFIFMVLGMLKNVFIYDAPVVDSVATIIKACFISIAGLILYLAGYFLSARKHCALIVPAQPAHNLSFSRSKLLFFLFAFMLLGLSNLLLYNPLEEMGRVSGEDTSNYLKSLIYFSIDGSLIAFILATVWNAKHSNRLNIGTIVLFIIFIFSVVTNMLRANRFICLTIFAFVFSFYFNRFFYTLKRKLNLKIILTGFAFLSLVFIVGNLSKTVGFYLIWKYRGGNEVSISEMSKNRALTLDFVDAFDNLCLVIEHYPDKDNYIYGWSIVAPFVSFIPRSIWPDKPYGFGRLLVEVAYGQEGRYGDSVAPSLLGELIANFSYIGALIIFFILGALSNYLNILFLKYENGSYQRITMFPLFYLFLMQHRGPFFNNVDAIAIIVPLYLALKYSSEMEYYPNMNSCKACT